MTVAEQIARAKNDYDEVYAAGKKAQYDDFWDKYQINGTQHDYKMMFAGRGWTNETFKPKYDIVPTTNATSMFQECSIKGSLKEILDELGISLRGVLVGVSNMFVNTSFTELPELDFSRINYPASTFLNMQKLHTLSIILPTVQKVNWNTTFNACPELVNLSLKGKIYERNGYAINLSWSKKLSKASIINLIDCLDESVVDQYITISLTAVNNAFETSAGAADGSTSAEWNALIATRSNWTINLLDA